MTKRLSLWSGLSLGLNVMLALACWQLWSAREAAVASSTPLPARVSSPEPPRPTMIEKQVTRQRVEEGTDVPISWADLASSDFFQYRDNLLAVGCPDRTIRDIIGSELDRWLRQRWRPILEVVQRDFWEIAARDGRDGFDEIEAQLSELRQERDELLLAVLGEQVQDPDLELERRQERFVQHHGWLPEDIQARLFELDQKHEEAFRILRDEIRARTDGHWTDEDHDRHHEQLERLEAEHEAGRKAALGEWADEFELRRSHRAHWASRLAGFEPTEDEWRAVTQAGISLDAALRQTASTDEHQYDRLMMERYGLAPQSSQGDVQAIADAQAQYESAVQAALGPERYADYQRAADQDFRQTRNVTQRLGLPDDVALQAWEIQRSARVAADELRAGVGLDDARRHAALEQLHAEAQSALQAALGERGYGTYMNHAGAWLEQLIPAK
jgi:hypothetical protein